MAISSGYQESDSKNHRKDPNRNSRKSYSILSNKKIEVVTRALRMKRIPKHHTKRIQLHNAKIPKDRKASRNFSPKNQNTTTTTTSKSK